MTYQPGPQLRIQKRQQQGRGETGRKYIECPNCGRYYLRSMYIPDRNGPSMKWIKIGLYCEVCGISYTDRHKEILAERGMDVSDFPF
ncbi:hypothetical protein Thermo_00097 [Thermoplasmatales archaeon]|nr:hypothetical protein Thermo_00097 [Thermoplasmatales archaeon]